jgi:hypothetical protein
VGTQKDNVRRGRRAAAGRAASAAVALREPTPEDASALAALFGELDYPSTAEQAAERLARIGADPSMVAIVAEADGEVAGLGALHVQNLSSATSSGVRSPRSSSASASDAAESARS